MSLKVNNRLGRSGIKGTEITAYATTPITQDSFGVFADGYQEFNSNDNYRFTNVKSSLVPYCKAYMYEDNKVLVVSGSGTSGNLMLYTFDTTSKTILNVNHVPVTSVFNNLTPNIVKNSSGQLILIGATGTSEWRWYTISIDDDVATISSEILISTNTWEGYYVESYLAKDDRLIAWHWGNDSNSKVKISVFDVSNTNNIQRLSSAEVTVSDTNGVFKYSSQDSRVRIVPINEDNGLFALMHSFESGTVYPALIPFKVDSTSITVGTFTQLATGYSYSSSYSGQIYYTFLAILKKPNSSNTIFVKHMNSGNATYGQYATNAEYTVSLNGATKVSDIDGAIKTTNIYNTYVDITDDYSLAVSPYGKCYVYSDGVPTVFDCPKIATKVYTSTYYASYNYMGLLKHNAQYRLFSVYDSATYNSNATRDYNISTSRIYGANVDKTVFNKGNGRGCYIKSIEDSGLTTIVT